MKQLLLLLLLILSPLSLMASVDESKTDVYFANGVDTTESKAWFSALEVLKPAITKEIHNNDITKRDQKIGKFDLLYNNTNGLILKKGTLPLKGLSFLKTKTYWMFC